MLDGGKAPPDLKLVKALSTYMCWTQAQLEGSPVHIINCYLEHGEAEKVRNHTLRFLEKVRDIIQQDKNAQIIICGDLNKQLPHSTKELRKIGFVEVF